jgi:hypothetical protein
MLNSNFPGFQTDHFARGFITATLLLSICRGNRRIVGIILMSLLLYSNAEYGYANLNEEVDMCSRYSDRETGFKTNKAEVGGGGAVQQGILPGHKQKEKKKLYSYPDSQLISS